MSKYETHAWAITIFSSLSVASFFVFQQHVMTDILARLFFMMGCYLGYCIARLWEVPWKDFTQTETQIAHKATAWTFYGTLVIIGLLISVLYPKEFLLSRDTLAVIMVYFLFIFAGFRFCVLAYLLRRERLSLSNTPLPDAGIPQTTNHTSTEQTQSEDCGSDNSGESR